MPKGIYERKKGAASAAPVSFQPDGVGSVADAAPNVTASAPKLVAMELKRNYRPVYPGYEIVGHTKPARVVKDAAGKEIIAQPEEFIDGEPFPHPFGSTGFADKMIAGTLIRVPVDEAERMKKLGIAERAIRD